MSETVEQHRERAGERRARCAVLTVSDSRTVDDDRSGDLVVEHLEAHRHRVVHRALVRDEAERIDERLQAFLADRVDLILTTGGTGIASRDTTIEVVERRIDKRLEGFGELFRMLSFEEIGAAAMLSRATGGLAGETLLFALPGSPNAVELALERLILPELPHLLWERKR